MGARAVTFDPSAASHQPPSFPRAAGAAVVAAAEVGGGDGEGAADLPWTAGHRPAVPCRQTPFPETETAQTYPSRPRPSQALDPHSERNGSAGHAFGRRAEACRRRSAAAAENPACLGPFVRACAPTHRPRCPSSALIPWSHRASARPYCPPIHFLLRHRPCPPQTTSSPQTTRVDPPRRNPPCLSYLALGWVFPWILWTGHCPSPYRQRLPCPRRPGRSFAAAVASCCPAETS
mmetsp:Transcript_45318/g.94934  ORF Transcript_45318/g.94934 Transcript_45318/m.94934 type:complete len:234 (+) Transcript_45318:616-1317(+)